MLYVSSLYLSFYCFSFLKLMAYLVEGRRTGTSRTGSRPSHRGYEKLKNINDIIPIDDTNPISDKDTVVLKT